MVNDGAADDDPCLKVTVDMSVASFFPLNVYGPTSGVPGSIAGIFDPNT